MRVDPDLYTNINSAMEQSEEQLQTAMNQLSSGKRVSLPSDDPLAFAENVKSLTTSATVDRYTRNADAVLSQAQMADSALSSVTTSLNQALSVGLQGGGSSVTSTERASLVQQVQGLLSSVISQANLTNNGVGVFAGTAPTSTPFVADSTSPSGYTYAGNSNSNEVQVGNSLQVTLSIPGNAVFTSSQGDVIGSLQQMISALGTGSTTDLANAASAVTAAIGHVGQIRAMYGSTVNELNAQNSFLSQETISLTSQQTSLTDVDTADAAMNLTQAQTQNSAVLAMAAKILPQSLLQYLQG